MKKAEIVSFIFLILIMVTIPLLEAFAATDGYYQSSQTAFTWVGSDANRQKAKTADYTYTYGDEASETYLLPWAFTFYGEAFNQITTDTNGNIWFGSSGSTHSFNLANNGRGPVISAWNEDLSSYYYGGVFIQHKTSPERVVIEWQTETYTNEGLRRPNNFEVVLFPNGTINLDYNAFTSVATNKDFGSGISLNDGRFVINLTTERGNVFELAGQSYLVTPTGSSLKTLDVGFAGGSGKISSNLGVSWTASNVTHFPTGAQVTLQATPGLCNKFDGWNGPCSGTGICTFPLNQDTVATAQFSVDIVRIVGKGSYPSLQAAYNAAADGDVIQATAEEFSENFTANRPISVTMDGGYSCGYISNPGKTIIKGMPSINSGTVTMKNFRIATDSGTNAFTITATAGNNGAISPSANVYSGDSQTYIITPATGYHVTDVVVDGVSQGAVNNYTFSNVAAAHTISASFAINTYTISAGAGSNGSIAPATSTLNYGGSQTFTMTPATGYHVADVVVDGVSQGAVTSYTFTNISAPHTITATFGLTAYTLTASAGGNGSISPASATVYTGGSQTITITPATGYHVADVLVDGVSQGAVTSYTFSNIAADHIISASFAINTYAITVIQGIGIITPASATVNHGGSQAFNISHTSRYMALDVKVDGVSQGNISSFTFNNVTSQHTIEAGFSMSPCSNPPARISGTELYFTSLQAAYNAAANGATIQAQGGQTFTENFVANRDISITMDGGYTCDYSANPDKTMLQGTPHLSSGTVNLKNFRVMQ